MSETLTTVSAHCAGRCALECFPDGTVITTGEDALLNVFKGEDDKTELEDLLDSKEVVALSRRPGADGQFATGSSTGEVDLCTVAEKVGKLTRLSLSIRDLEFSPDGRTIAVSSDESIVKLVDVDDILKSQDLAGHDGPVKSVSWSPDGKYLATLGCDGMCKLWDTTDWRSKDCLLVKSFSALAKDSASDPENPLRAKLAFDPTGKFLALPTSSGVKLLEVGGNWAEACSLANAHAKPVSIVAWSPNSLYLVSVGMDKKVVIWDLATREPVRQSTTSEFIVDLRWSLVDNTLFCIDNEGGYARVTPAIPVALPPPVSSSTATVTPTHLVEGGDNNDSGENRPTNQANNVAPTQVLDDEAEEATAEDDDSKPASNSATSVLNMKKDLGLDASMDGPLTDEQERKLLREQLEKGEQAADDDEDDEEDKARVIVKHVERKVPERQEAFQPSSTPDDERRRFLCWNAHGSIVSRDEESYSAVEIEFADAAKNRNIRFTDYYGFELGALGENGAFFASYGRDEDDQNIVDEFGNLNPMDDQGKRDGANNTQSTIFYRPFDAWAHNAEWVMQLPNHEQATAVAVGTTYCAVSTTKQLIRVFRPSGLQEAPVALEGPVLTMVGAGPLLAVFYHLGEPTSEGTQSIAYKLLHMGDGNKGPLATAQAVVCQGRFPVNPATIHTLRWVGFADESVGYMPLALDGEGMLLGLAKSAGWQWVPVLDTNSVVTSKSEHSWPISVQAGKLVTVILKNKTHPPTMPRPVVMSFPLCVPLLGLTASKGAAKYKLQEAVLMDEVKLSQRIWADGEAQRLGDVFEGEEAAEIAKAEALIDAKVLKHLVLAIKLEKGARAVGLAQRLRLVKSLEIALIQAQKEGGANSVIASKIEQVLDRRQAEEQQLAEEDDEQGEAGGHGSSDEECNDMEQDESSQSSLLSTRRITKRVSKTSSQDDDAEFPSTEASKRKAPPSPTRTSGGPVNPFAKRTKACSPKPEASSRPAATKKSPVQPVLSRDSTFSKIARNEMHKQKRPISAKLNFGTNPSQENRTKKKNDVSA